MKRINAALRDLLTQLAEVLRLTWRVSWHHLDDIGRHGLRKAAAMQLERDRARLLDQVAQRLATEEFPPPPPAPAPEPWPPVPPPLPPLPPRDQWRTVAPPSESDAAWRAEAAARPGTCVYPPRRPLLDDQGSRMA